MLVIIKSSPDTPDGRRGVKLARDMAADVCLIQNAVYFVQGERIEGCCGNVFVLDDDMRLRGLRDEDLEKDIKKITYDSLVDMMAAEDRVVGMF